MTACESGSNPHQYRVVTDVTALDLFPGVGVVASIAGTAGSIAGIYLFDRGMSRGDDLAVGLIGLCAVGTFVFVIVFCGLCKLHNAISWRTTALALILCLTATIATTLVSMDMLWSDSHWVSFVETGYIVVLFFGLAALLVSRYFYVR